jgi:hypothetical protein
MGKWGVIVKALLNGHVLDVHCFFSKITMATNSETIMKGDCLMNCVTRLSTKINSSSILKHKFLEFIKLTEIGCVQVLGTMENERCFSTMAFMKNKSRNHLT